MAPTIPPTALPLLAALALAAPARAVPAAGEPERWTVPAGARVRDLRPGVQPGEERHPEVGGCRDFRLTERQVLRFLALARVIDEPAERREFNWSPCLVQGVVAWPGGSAHVTVSALLVGAVRPAGGRLVRLGCDGACRQALRAEAGAASAPPTPPPEVLEPGVALGKLRLGDRRAAIHARLGPPRWITGTEASRVETWAAPAGVRIGFEGEVVRQVESSAGGWATPDGLGPDTPVATWLADAARWQVKAYRASRGTGAVRLACYLDDVERGIAILLEEQPGPGQPSPGPARKPPPLRLGLAVVHPPGVPAVPEAGLVPAPELAGRCPLGPGR